MSAARVNTVSTEMLSTVVVLRWPRDEANVLCVLVILHFFPVLFNQYSSGFGFDIYL